MKRPCSCDNCEIGKPWDRSQCRLCWLANNDVRYQRLWTEPADRPLNIAKRFGPGTELKSLLRELRITSYAGCGCDDKVRQMNTWGVEGCREHFDTIRGWIIDAQEKAGWAATITAAIAATVNGLAFVIDPTDVAGSLVRIAIERAENATLQS